MVKEFFIKPVINKFFERYGKVLTLKIDSNNKTMSAEVILKGESEPIMVSIGRYEVHSEGRQGLALSNIQTSRPWMTEIAAAMGPEIFVPIGKARLLGILL
jgi:hypothetical protein